MDAYATMFSELPTDLFHMHEPSLVVLDTLCLPDNSLVPGVLCLETSCPGVMWHNNTDTSQIIAILHSQLACSRLPASIRTWSMSYGPPWAHYLGGYQDRLLGGPLGLPGLRYTAPEGVEHKDYTGVVLG
jgi:hypothetical protein